MNPDVGTIEVVIPGPFQEGSTQYGVLAAGAVEG